MSNAVSAAVQQQQRRRRAYNSARTDCARIIYAWPIQQTDQRHSEAAWDDTWRIEMKCAFPGHDSYELLFLFAEGICRRTKTC